MESKSKSRITEANKNKNIKTMPFIIQTRTQSFYLILSQFQKLFWPKHFLLELFLQ